MLTIYPAVFHKEDGHFWVEFPDLPGCQTVGIDEREAYENALDALGGYLASKIEHDEAVKKPSSLYSLLNAVNDGFINAIGVDVTKYMKNTKAVKKTLTIPEWLNDEAMKKNINFSRVLQDALIKEIDQ